MRLTTMAMLTAVLGCGETTATPTAYEGDDPGECSDGADNDRDGLYDCDDPGCASAPACTGADADGDADGDVGVDGHGEDEGLIIWRINGTEVARGTGAEVPFSGGAPTGVFVPWGGRNFNVTFVAPVAVRRYDCSDVAASTISLGGSSIDDFLGRLAGLPTRWKDLYFNCGPSADTADLWVRFDETGARLRGAFGVTVIGSGPRAGETLTMDGAFNIGAVPPP